MQGQIDTGAFQGCQRRMHLQGCEGQAGRKEGKGGTAQVCLILACRVGLGQSYSSIIKTRRGGAGVCEEFCKALDSVPPLGQVSKTDSEERTRAFVNVPKPHGNSDRIRQTLCRSEQREAVPSVLGRRQKPVCTENAG